MASPLYSNVIVSLSAQVDNLTTNFIQHGYTALMNALRAPLVSLSVLFIVLTGYGITRGLIKAPLEELVKFSIRLGIIELFAMNWGFFADNMLALFVNGAGELGSALMKSTNLMPQSFSNQGVMGGLQSVFNEVIRAGAWVAKKATFRHPSPLLSALLIYASGMIVIGIALMELVIAKLMLSLCLVTAPLFFCLTLFDKTRAFFDRWLGALAGFSLVLIFVSGVVGLCMSLIHWSVADYANPQNADVVAVGWIPILLVSCFCTVAISQAAHIAKAIGGACHTAGGSAMVGGFIGGAMGAASTLKSGFNKFKQLNPSSNTAFSASNQSTAGSSHLMQNIHNSLRGES